MTENEETHHAEVPGGDFEKLNELLLRGLNALHDHEDYDHRDLDEYGRVMDEFLDEAGAPRRIGDQPEEVREFWDELMEEDR